MPELDEDLVTERDAQLFSSFKPFNAHESKL